MRGLKLNSVSAKSMVEKGIAWAWVALAFLVDMWYQYVPGKWITDGDLAGELLLADLLNKEKAILSANWFYTTELRVFETQWFYRIGLVLFPHNWHMARVFAAAALTILLVCACLYFAKAIKLGIYGVWAAGFLIWPFGFWHLFLSIYGLYYMVYMIFSLFTAGLILNYVKEKKLYKIAIALLLAFCSGLNGVRQSIVFFVPLILTAIIILLLSLKEERNIGISDLRRNHSNEFSLFISSGAVLLANLLGYLINAVVFSKRYQYRSFSDFAWGYSAASPLVTLLDFLKLFGYVEGAEVLSLEGFASICGVIIALVLVIISIVLLITAGKYDIEKKFVIVLFPVMVVFETIVFAFLGNYTINYWLPLICFAVIIIALGLSEFKVFINPIKTSLVVILSAFIIIASMGAIKKELTAPLRGKPGLMEVSKWLAENDYNVVVASFWNADQITEFTNGQVEVYIASLNGAVANPWLQKVSHKELPMGDYIQLINTNDGECIENYASYQNATLMYSYTGVEAYYIE